MKRGKKLLSVILSMTMAFSAVGAVFAASAAQEDKFKQDYTGTSVETVDRLLTDANAFLQKKVWNSLGGALNGSLVQTIYGLYPSLEGSKALIGLENWAFLDAATYKGLDPQVFEALPDGAVDADILAAYFADHPIKADGDAFWDSLAKATVPLLGESTIGRAVAKSLADVSQLLKDLGVENAPVLHFDFVGVDEQGVLTVAVPVQKATLSGVKPNGDLGMALDSFFPGYDKMTPEELGAAIYAKFGKNAYNFATTSVGTQNEPLAMAGKDSSGNACLVRPSSIVDYSELAASSAPETLTVTIVNMWTGKPYTAVMPNPFKAAGEPALAVNGTPLYVANNTLSNPENQPAQLADFVGNVADSQGNLLYVNAGATNNVALAIDASTQSAKIVGFLKDILTALQPDAVGTLLGAIRVLSAPQAQVDFLKFAKNLNDHLAGTLGTLAVGLGSMSTSGYNISDLILQIQSLILAMPGMTKTVTIDGQEQDAFDFNQLLDYIGTKLSVIPALDEDGNHLMKPDLSNPGQFTDFWQTVPLGITFSAIGSDALPLDMSNADTFMMTYHYLFSNLVSNEANLNKLLGLVSLFVPDLDLSAFVPLIQSMDANSLLELIGPMLHEMVFPPVTLSDEATGVKLFVQDGAMIPDGSTLLVEKVDSGVDFGTLDVAKYQAYRISIMSDGKAVQPVSGTVQVSIPAAEGYDAAKTAVYTQADGVMTQANASVKDSFYTFDTASVGLTALVELKDAVTTEPTQPDADDNTTAPDNNGGNGNVDTGDIAIGAIAAVTLLAGAAVVLLKKKRV